MSRQSKLLISAILMVAIVTAAVFFFYHRVSSVPEAATLLPEGDLLIYVNLKPLHLIDLSKSNPVQVEGEYKDFVAQTGIQFERDLDEVAMSRRDTPDGRDIESSEIFAGRFDVERVKNYLLKLSLRAEQYRDHVIYSIQHEGHNVRATFLDNTHLAATNMPSPEPMHGIIDRSLKDRSFKPTNGPALLSGYYSRVPLGSVAWMIDRIPNKPGNLQLPGGFALTLPADAVAVASVRYAGNLLLRADLIAQSEAQAKQIADSANTNLTMVRSIGQSLGMKGPDADIKAAFDSIQIAQKENVAVFTATVPQTILKKLWSEARPEPAVPTPTATPVPRKR